jgi:hypothetical protein
MIVTLQKNTVTRQLHATTSWHESSLTTKIRDDNNSTIDCSANLHSRAPREQRLKSWEEIIDARQASHSSPRLLFLRLVSARRQESGVAMYGAYQAFSYPLIFATCNLRTKPRLKRV